jgi:hypothetical protein
MKMYYFNPNGYGHEYFMIAENKIKAHEYLLKYLSELLSDEKEKCYYDLNLKNFNWWKNINLEDNNTMGSYTLDEYNVGEVVYTECC